ncbi:MAG: helix-hairpin-helix domain-containing protein [Candidatus Thermoplasmatota archaeon]
MSSDREDLKVIKGVGASTEERIKETLDVESIEELADLSKEELVEVKGIGEKTAETILENAEDLVRKCGRCQSVLVGEEKCESCLEELEEKYEALKEEIESLDLLEEVEIQLDSSLSKIESYIEEGDVETGFEAVESLKEDVKNTIVFSNLLKQVNKKMDENSEALDFSIYNKKVEILTKLLEKGKYERGIRRARKILDNIEDEKSLAELDRDELKDQDITEFCRKIAGVKSHTGEKLYKHGYNTVKEVGSAGQIQLIEDAEIDGDEADVLIKRIRDFVGDIEFEVDRREREKPKEEEEEEKEEKEEEEDVFLEVEPSEELREKREEQKRKKREKRGEERPEKEPKTEPKVHVPAEKEVTQEGKAVIKEEEKVAEEEVSEIKKIYWVPAVLLPIIFIVIGIVLFLL